VIPIYNEREILPELFRRLRAVLDALPDTQTQVIYVNDGSRDGSLEIMIEQNRQDARFTVLELSRNFGHQAALAAGLSVVKADAVVLMDGDLQDPPEVIPDMVASWRAGAQVVRAERRSRAERGVRRLGFALFHKAFGLISDFPIPPEVGIFGLLDRQALEQLRQLPEKNRFLPGLRSWIGFDQRTIHYDRPDRFAGAPKQTFRRLLRYAMDGIFSFSYKPLRLMTGAGVFISALGFSLACFFVVRRLLDIEIAPTGFTTLVTLVLFLGGIQLVAIGLLGEYLGRIYDEVKQRPLFIVKRAYGLDEVPDGNRPS
jgi:dolichol-phosphate mannosyltransferase